MKNFQWFLLIGRNFFRITPSQTLTSIFLALVSKLAGILVSYLPLKVVILLGSSGIPKFFPASFQQFDREFLVISLCGATVVFYLIYLISEKLLTKVTEMGAETILKNTRKMPLFENQTEISQKGFQRYSQSLAETFFLSIAIVVLSWLYPSVLLVMVTYGVLAVILLRFFLLATHHSDKDYNPKSMLIMLFDIGYLIVFVFMIYQAINGNGPSILVMILTFILIRQFQTSLKKVISNITSLLSQHVQINALFFGERVLVRNKKSHEDSFWALAESSSVRQWAGSVIERLTEEKPEQLTCHWLQLDLRDILVFRISVRSASTGRKDEYLIKLFGKKQSLAAQHESELILQIPELPSLELLAVDEIQGFHCLLFGWENGEIATFNEAREERFSLDESLMKVIPPSLFVEKYLRSHPILPQRLNQQFWQHVQSIGDLMENKISDAFKALLEITEDIDTHLNLLPLTVINPKLSWKMLLKTDSNKRIALHWNQWSIEPIGAGWSTNGHSLDQLPDVINVVRECRDDIKGVNNSAIRLAALMYAFENFMYSQKFHRASELVPEILVCLEGK